MLDGQGESISQPGWYTWGIGYGYDANGHLASHAYPNSFTVTYAPNALGQPTQVGSYATNVSYWPNGAIKQFTYGNLITHTLTQNTRGLPTTSCDAYGACGSSAVLRDTYAYDPSGNVLKITDGVGTAQRGNRDMTYDGLDRLKTAMSPMFSAITPDSTARYDYDALDNLTHVIAPGRNHQYCYNALWQLEFVREGSSCTSGLAVTTLEYDPQGNLGSKNNQDFVFDFGNRLRAATGLEHYRYDGHGRRVLAWSAQGLGNIVSQYSSAGQLMYQYDQRRAKYFGYLYLGSSLVAIREQAVVGGAVTFKYQHTDALGSPVAVTDANRIKVEYNEYEPFGKVLVPAAPHDGPGYTGHVYDSLTGLNYMQQRYYDPEIGRFLSVDPVAANPSTGASFNRYKYAANNPYTFVDPDGRAESTWFTPDDKRGLYEAGLNFHVPKFHSISAHANDQEIIGPNGQRFGGADAVAFAQKNDGLMRGQPIFAAACNVASGNAQLAQDMANANQSLVIAARGYVNVPSTMDLNGDGKGMYQPGKPVTLTVSAKDGSPRDFALFKPGGSGPLPNIGIRSISIDPATKSITGMTLRIGPETGSRIWRTEKIDLSKK